MYRTPPALLAGVLLICLHARPGIALDVTTCGQVVQGRASLVADLDCSAYSGIPVTLDRAKLLMNGFRIVGNPSATDPDDPSLPAPVVHCVGNRCAIVGPGIVTGAGGPAGCCASGAVVSDGA